MFLQEFKEATGHFEDIINLLETKKPDHELVALHKEWNLFESMFKNVELPDSLASFARLIHDLKIDISACSVASFIHTPKCELLKQKYSALLRFMDRWVS